MTVTIYMADGKPQVLSHVAEIRYHPNERNGVLRLFSDTDPSGFPNGDTLYKVYREDFLWYTVEE